jgi:hypothetical protein
VELTTAQAVRQCRIEAQGVDAVDEPERRYDKYAGLGEAEKAEAIRAELYQTHKAHGTLGVYYSLYPDEAPIRPQRDRDDGRER